VRLPGLIEDLREAVGIVVEPIGAGGWAAHRNRLDRSMENRPGFGGCVLPTGGVGGESDRAPSRAESRAWRAAGAQRKQR
jgi:hypothetical protein